MSRGAQHNKKWGCLKQRGANRITLKSLKAILEMYIHQSLFKNVVKASSQYFMFLIYDYFCW